MWGQYSARWWSILSQTGVLMKAIQIQADQLGRPLVWEETPDPTYGPDEVLVDIYATALNRADL